MSKGDGGGVSIRFGFHGLPVSGEKRPKLTQAIEIDCHLNKKRARDEARGKVEKHKKRAGPSTAEKKADKKGRQSYREASKEVVVVERVGGEINSVRTIKRS
ncbi:hypothetical protein [Sphingomonas sp. Leaf339]|uniref:hypothetical protein n=1 Tax=Sphingomonas sp. Leaf339 TaxID=1736343 RepID=UPI0012E350E1|nr:hypothetical protein [Sphingomonas sp. Leaf339]